jgi:hypothetical protein
MNTDPDSMPEDSPITHQPEMGSNQPNLQRQRERVAPGIPVEAETLLFDLEVSARRLSISVHMVRKLIRQRRLRAAPGIHKILIADDELRRFAKQ